MTSSASRPRVGFTLMEVILVLAIIVLVAAVAIPSFQAWSYGYRLQQGVDTLRTLWIKARTAAMEEGRPYRFQYILGTGSYRLAPDDVENWPELAGDVTGPNVSGLGYPMGLQVQGELPIGVTFLSPFNEPEMALLFQPDGTARIYGPDGAERPDLILGLVDSQGNARYLQVRALTGGVSVLNLNFAGW
ncbi:MAG: prepilin-type N-terminal cleavage/methylation domain-containing protein [Gemmatales bacterium]|nr:prepilin-type N-terminal cleavage/methylation domain-containing protein [Gemmatales bacterium]MDW8386893.1 prepilin-type N-terminal cleavage/methylation domain-containing protein [Gemmatales bacterium]